MDNRKNLLMEATRRNQRIRGIAMLTVLVILTILAIFATAFVQQVRIQLATSTQAARRMTVSDVTTSGLGLLGEEFKAVVYGPDQLPYTGDEIRPFVSLIDPWHIGTSGILSPMEPRSVFEARNWNFNQYLLYPKGAPALPLIRIHNGGSFEFRQLNGQADPRLFASRLGIDEDPPGDLSMDGKPGFFGVDDNLDGIIDNKNFSAEDDDEDGIADEDGLDRRDNVLLDKVDARVNAILLGWDKDGDYTGIDPGTGRININTAGNQNGPGGTHVYHQGLYPGEIDLETFMTLCLGQTLGFQLVHGFGGSNFPGIIRYRSGMDGLPGIGGVDDNKNSLSSASYGSSGDPRFNQIDDDLDGLTDEEDEIPATYSGDYWDGIGSDLLDNRANRAVLLVNGVDDDNDGITDNIFEIDKNGSPDNPAVDELAENRPENPFTDSSGARDTPFASRQELGNLLVDSKGLPLKVLSGVPDSPTVFELIERFITVRSSSPRQRKDFPNSPDNYYNRQKLNPNLIMPGFPTGLDNAHPTAADLLALAGLDNDGDWGTNTLENPGTLQARVIPDDLNRNMLPDGDWDGRGEWDRNNNVDDDRDGRPDDDGDDNKDSLIGYDPEPRINEDPPKFLPVTTRDTSILNELRNPTPNPSLNFQNRPIQANHVDREPGDGIDNNSNSARWMSDGIDNDFDGLTDETRLDDYREIRKTINDPATAWEMAADEGVDEIDEFYYESWDDDRDHTRVTPAPTPAAIPTPLPIRRMDEDPLDVVLVANMIDAIDFKAADDEVDGVTTVSIRSATTTVTGGPIAGVTLTTTTAYGNEAVRITEVLARPLMRLQAENIDPADRPGSPWQETSLVTSGTQTQSSGRYYRLTPDGTINNSQWTFKDIPKGNYYVLAYSLYNSSPRHTLGTNSTVTANGTAMNFIAEPANAQQIELFGGQYADRLKNGRVFYTPAAIPISGQLSININTGGRPNISFDYIELYAPLAQYVEIANFGEKTFNLNNWEIRVGSYDDLNKNGIFDRALNEPESQRIIKIEPGAGQDASDLDLKPGQFAILYRDHLQSPGDIASNGPSQIEVLKPRKQTNGGEDPLVLGYPSGATEFLNLTLNLGELIFGQDGAKRLELYAPEKKNPAPGGGGPEKMVLVDAFYYNPASDFCTPSQRSRRQDDLAFAPQHRGDPTASVLHLDVKVDTKNTADPVDDTTTTYYNYVHGPKRFLAVDAAVTYENDPHPTPQKLQDAAGFKAGHVIGQVAPGSVGGGTQTALDLIQHWTEYGEPLVRLSATRTVTFHWPGILNWFRNPDEVDGKRYPLLFVRAGGISPNSSIGLVDLDPTDPGERLAKVYHGDLLYVINPNLSDADDRYKDIFDKDHDSLRITFKADIANATAYFAYLEISPGWPDQITTPTPKGPIGRIAGDPGAEWFFFPDKDLDGQFFYMDRRRNLYDGNANRQLAVQPFQRSLRFREGTMASCSPYLPGPGGRNMEKYSMGRGVFSGPTLQEMRQIASHLDFHADPQVEGLININCADQKVLCALPFFPPEAPSVLNVNNRMSFAALMSQVLIMGRSQRGFDGELGFPDVDDDGDGRVDLADIGAVAGGVFRNPPMWDAPVSGSGSNTRMGFGRFNYNDDGMIDVETGMETDDPDEMGYPGSDDGPYVEVGDMASAMLHPIVVAELREQNRRSLGLLKPATWRDWDEESRPVIDESDLFIILGRVANMSTVQSNEFMVTSRGRIFNVDSAVPPATPRPPEQVAEQKIEAEFGR